MTDVTPVQPDEHQITITRVFDAPRELVFRAWTDPDQLARWFGPAGMETPRESIDVDLRVGGHIHLRMVKPGSAMEHPLRYEIAALVEPELLVLEHGPMSEVGLHKGTVTRIELEEADGKTLMTLTDGPYPEAGGAGADAGWAGAFDKLAALVDPSG